MLSKGCEETAGMGYLEACSWGWTLALRLIWRIARAENDRVKRRVVIGITVKPPDLPHKADGRVNAFRVGDVLEDPTDAMRVGCVLSPNAFQVIVILDCYEG